jgi:hypothetical protein
MKLLALFLLACAAMAEAPKPAPMAEIDALKLENVSLRLDLMTKEIEAIHRERNELIRGICAAASVPIEKCLIDPVKRTVSTQINTKKEPN